MTSGRYHHGNLREALLDAAIEVIRQDGAGAVSLRGLARTLGVSHAAPARHFKSKADLLNAIVVQGYTDLGGVMVAAGSAVDGGPRDRLRAMAVAYLRWAKRNPAHYSAMRSPAVGRHASAPVSRALVDFSALPVPFVLEAREAGWRADVPLHLVALELVGGLIGAATIVVDPLLRATLPYPDDIEEYIQYAVDSLLA